MIINSIEMLSEKEMAELFNCSQRTIKRKTQRGELIAVDFCNSIKYPKQFYKEHELTEINKRYLNIKETSKIIKIGNKKIDEMLNAAYEDDTFFHCKQIVNNKQKINTRQLLAYINQNIIYNHQNT